VSKRGKQDYQKVFGDGFWLFHFLLFPGSIAPFCRGILTDHCHLAKIWMVAEIFVRPKTPT
jgi:hypothetical protein